MLPVLLMFLLFHGLSFSSSLPLHLSGAQSSETAPEVLIEGHIMRFVKIYACSSCVGVKKTLLQYSLSYKTVWK